MASGLVNVCNRLQHTESFSVFQVGRRCESSADPRWLIAHAGAPRSSGNPALDCSPRPRANVPVLFGRPACADAWDLVAVLRFGATSAHHECCARPQRTPPNAWVWRLGLRDRSGVPILAHRHVTIRFRGAPRARLPARRPRSARRGGGGHRFAAPALPPADRVVAIGPWPRQTARFQHIRSLGAGRARSSACARPAVGLVRHIARRATRYSAAAAVGARPRPRLAASLSSATHRFRRRAAGAGSRRWVSAARVGMTGFRRAARDHGRGWTCWSCPLSIRGVVAGDPRRRWPSHAGRVGTTELASTHRPERSVTCDNVSFLVPPSELPRCIRAILSFPARSRAARARWRGARPGPVSRFTR